MELISVKRIWDQGEHNAFTDLVLFQGALFCVFREGSAHVSPDGALRVLRSQDAGGTWQSVSLLTSTQADLRDGKLIEFRGELLLLGGGAHHDKSGLQSYLWRSKDGMHWSEAQVVADKGYWLWRLTEHQDALYGVGYRAGPDGDTRLYKSDDGQQFKSWMSVFNNQGYVNESSLVFHQGSCFCLLRRDPVWSDEFLGLLGHSLPPFNQWTWQTLDKRIGGPVMFVYQSRLMAVVRLYEGNIRTALIEINKETSAIHEWLTLPSQGDTSYAGIVLEGDDLYVSYYSSHEMILAPDNSQVQIEEIPEKSKTMIYFAKIRLSN
ncbi:exo-alpha-sialidase [Shewanella decolorationis]|uniref:exo-alpha-sialidase n=1 Tax=Shewanella decolorationis TaxID=256839 RepID=UPI0010573D30|nr:exo-alpha-sialidase [Shewanella decolorationis]